MDESCEMLSFGSRQILLLLEASLQFINLFIHSSCLVYISLFTHSSYWLFSFPSLSLSPFFQIKTLAMWLVTVLLLAQQKSLRKIVYGMQWATETCFRPIRWFLFSSSSSSSSPLLRPVSIFVLNCTVTSTFFNIFLCEKILLTTTDITLNSTMTPHLLPVLLNR